MPAQNILAYNPSGSFVADPRLIAAATQNPIGEALLNTATFASNFAKDQGTQLQNIDKAMELSNKLALDRNNLLARTWLSNKDNAARMADWQARSIRSVDDAAKVDAEMRAILPPETYSILSDYKNWRSEGRAEDKNAAEVNQANASALHSKSLAASVNEDVYKKRYDLSRQKYADSILDKKPEGIPMPVWMDQNPVLFQMPGLWENAASSEKHEQELRVSRQKDELDKLRFNGALGQQQPVVDAQGNPVVKDGLAQTQSPLDQIREVYKNDPSKAIAMFRSILGQNSGRYSNEVLDSYIRGVNLESGLTANDKAYLTTVEQNNSNLSKQRSQAFKDVGLGGMDSDNDTQALYGITKEQWDKVSTDVLAIASRKLNELGITAPSQDQLRLASKAILSQVKSSIEAKKWHQIFTGNISFNEAYTADEKNLDTAINEYLTRFKKHEGKLRYFRTPDTLADPNVISSLIATAKEQAAQTGESASKLFRDLFQKRLDQEFITNSWGLSENDKENLMDIYGSIVAGRPVKPLDFNAVNTRKAVADAARLKKARLTQERPAINASVGDINTLLRASTETLQEIATNPTQEEMQNGIYEKAQQVLAERLYPTEKHMTQNKQEEEFGAFLENPDSNSLLYQSLQNSSRNNVLRQDYEQYASKIRKRYTELKNIPVKERTVQQENELTRLEKQMNTISSLSSYLPAWKPTPVEVNPYTGRPYDPRPY